MILLFTSENLASKNIAEKLITKHDFVKKADDRWERDGVELIDTKVSSILDVPYDFDTDCIIVLSSHKSKAGNRMLTAHFPGNWKEAKFGGMERTLNIAYASKLKILIRELSKANKDLKWPVFIEADHHGPTCNVPIIFVELGSTEKEWRNEKAGEVVAKAVSSFLTKRKTYKTSFGVGGGHYAKEFTKLVLESEMAVGHIAPKYVLDEFDEEMFKQAIEKSVETVSRVLILKEGTNASQKKKIIEFCGKLGLEYELV